MFVMMVSCIKRFQYIFFIYIGKFLSPLGLEPGTSHKPSHPFTTWAKKGSNASNLPFPHYSSMQISVTKYNWTLHRHRNNKNRHCQRLLNKPNKSSYVCLGNTENISSRESPFWKAKPLLLSMKVLFMAYVKKFPF